MRALVGIHSGTFLWQFLDTGEHNMRVSINNFTDWFYLFLFLRSRVDIEECLAAFTEQETLDGNEQPVSEVYFLYYTGA